MATVTFEHVEKVYDSKQSRTHAVRDFCLDVADEEFVVLVGPSGCGKTTTLRLLAGLEEATKGEIRIGKRLVNDVAPKDRDIAMVFQDHALYPHMTVFANMAFGLSMRHVARADIEAAVTQVAAVLGISRLLGRKPADLSGGERQRVAIGRAIVRRPKVFLFDEPLSNLDAKLRAQMRTELKSLHAALATTAIYVTHDQEEAMTLGDRLVIMEDGRIQQCGTPLELYDRPHNRFVAGFIGTPAMNFIEGRLEGSGSGAAFACAAGTLPLSDEAARTLQAHAGTEVTLGIRPEHLRLDGDSRSIRATVAVVEALGSSVNLHVTDKAGHAVVARVAPTSVISVGDTVDLTLDLSRAHFFARGDAGERIN